MASAPSDLAEARIEVRYAFSGEQIASLGLAVTQCVRELKLLLEEYTGVPAAYQVLLRQDEVLPLRDESTLLEERLGLDSTVLFAGREPRHADVELWESSQGCRCGFGEVRGVSFDYLAEKTCGCEGPSGSGPSTLHVRYLLRALSDSATGLQELFERTVLGGRTQAALELAKGLARDPRVNVNATGCPYQGMRSLLELAAAWGRVDMCRVLVESGRLRVDFNKAWERARSIYEWTDENGDWAWRLMYKVLGCGPQDLRGSMAAILAGLPSHESAVCKLIAQERWQGKHFCRSYVSSFRRAIAKVVEHILQEVDAADACAIGVDSSNHRRKQNTAHAGPRASSKRRHSKLPLQADRKALRRARSAKSRAHCVARNQAREVKAVAWTTGRRGE